MIRSIKDVIRREASADPRSFWSDHIMPAVIVLRLSAAQSHGYPPFTVVTGLIPMLFSNLTRAQIITPPVGEASEAEEAAYVDKLRQVIHRVRLVVKTRLAKLEAKLRRKLTKAELQEIDVETLFHYKVGDLVLRCRKALGKL